MKKAPDFLCMYNLIFILSTIFTETQSQDITLFDKSHPNGLDRVVFIDPSISNQISYLENEGSEFDSDNFYDRAYRMAKTERRFVPVERREVSLKNEDDTKEITNTNANERTLQTIRKHNLVPEIPQRQVRAISRHLALDNNIKNKHEDNSDLRMVKKKRRSLPTGGKSRQKRQAPFRFKKKKRNTHIQKVVPDKPGTLTSNKNKCTLKADDDRPNSNRQKRAARFNQRNGGKGIRKRRSVKSIERSRSNNKSFKTQNTGNDLLENESDETENKGYDQLGDEYYLEEREPKWESKDSEENEDDYKNVVYDEEEKALETKDQEYIPAEETEEETDRYEKHNRAKRHFHTNVNLPVNDNEYTEEEESFAAGENEDGKFEELDNDLEQNVDYNNVQYNEEGDEMEEIFGNQIEDPNSDAERKETEKYLSGNEVQPAGRCGHEDTTECGQREECKPQTTRCPVTDCEMKPHHRPDAKNRCKPKPNECCDEPEYTTKRATKKRVVRARPKRLVWMFNPWRWGWHRRPCQTGCARPKGHCGAGSRCKVTPVK